MRIPSPSHEQTPSQTAGPYVHIGLAPWAAGFEIFDQTLGQDIAGPNAAGERIRIEGRVLDGHSCPVKDVLIETWQANAAGVYAHPADGRAVEEGFRGFGRVIPDFETGAFAFETIKPGANGAAAPHLTLWLVARGINIGLHTRLYFSDEAAANAADPVLTQIEWESRRATLIAARAADQPLYRFDIHLQGEAETVFFDM